MTDPATAALLADLRQTFTRMDEAIARLEKHFTGNANFEATDLLSALWVCTEHNALHFGENHNTVIQGRAAIKKAQANPHTPWDGRAGSEEDGDGFVREAKQGE